jgi:hypothetical protein
MASEQLEIRALYKKTFQLSLVRRFFFAVSKRTTGDLKLDQGRLILANSSQEMKVS